MNSKKIVIDFFEDFPGINIVSNDFGLLGMVDEYGWGLTCKHPEKTEQYEKVRYDIIRLYEIIRKLADDCK